MKPLYFFLLLTLSACSSLQYKTTSAQALPELGTIGVYQKYALGDQIESKTVMDLSDPVRLAIQPIHISERQLFQKKDSLVTTKDSTLYRIEILDKMAIASQLNVSKGLEYLKKAEDCKIVTSVTLDFPSNIVTELESADELYLVQKKEKTLSVELRKNNKIVRCIEFTEGKIIDFETSAFCWGQNKRKDIVIFDLVPAGSACNANTYKSAAKAKKKHEIDFFK